MKPIAYIFAVIAALALYGICIGQTHQWLIMVIAGTLSAVIFREEYIDKHNKENGNEQS